MIRSFLLLLVFVIGACPLMGQALSNNNSGANKHYLWSKIDNIAVANDGKWFAYKKTFPEIQKDTVYIVDTKHKLRYKIPYADIVQFSKNSKWLIGRNYPNSYTLINLRTGKRRYWEEQTQVGFLPGLKRILLHYKSQNKLEIINDHKEESEVLTGVLEFKLHPKSSYLAVILEEQQTYQLKLIKITADTLQEVWVSEKSPTPFANPVFNIRGSVLAFFKEVRGHKNTQQLNVIKLNQGQVTLEKLSTKDLSAVGSNAGISTKYLRLSPDGQHVYFKSIFPTTEEPLPENPQIWKANEKWLYPRKKKFMRKKNEFWTVWNLGTDNVTAIESIDLPEAIFRPGANVALLLKNSSERPVFRLFEEKDVYLKDLQTGQIKKLLNNYKAPLNTLGIAPSGKYIRYFKDKHWWVYHCISGEHIKMSEKISEPVTDISNDIPHTVKTNGSPGWTKEEKGVLIYGTYDIWWVALDGSRTERLTNGRKTKTHFRLLKFKKASVDFKYAAEPRSRTINLEEGLWLQAVATDYDTGLYKWTKENGLQKILSKNAMLDQWVCNDDGNWCTYRQQSYNQSTSVWGLINKKKTNKQVQSNRHMKKTEWGHSEQITYYDSRNNELKAALFYPSGYQPDKKYPMIVYIYEKMSRNLHRFFLPVRNQTDGFSPTIYTQDGYLVLFPDIVYQIGNPGFSALDDVKAAVNKVIAKGIVKENKIGLIGHSFGGYEATFIVSQTDKFAAVVAGGAPVDLVNEYHSMGGIGRGEMWRFENYQMRMGIPFYENPNAYIQNSPLYHSLNITTPLLLWTGEKDPTVHPRNSKALFLALRRMGKQATLFIYPDETHILFEPKNQIHLTNSIKDWFNHYLKNMPQKNWMK